MKCKRKWILLLFITIPISCIINPVTPEFSSDYFPLHLGNKWSYEFFVRTPAGNDTMTLDYEIIGKKQVNGTKYYEFNYRMPFFPKSGEFPGLREPLFRPDKNGNIRTVIDNSEWIFLIFNESSVDSMIQYKLKLGTLDHWIFVSSTTDTVQTPVGYYHDCYKILSYFPQIMGSEYFIWFARGYGPVKIWYPESNITYKLIEVNIN